MNYISKKIAIILGTRPEIIKMSPIIRECQKQGLEYFILHTNQHFSPEMDEVFFEELMLPQPKYNLGISNEKLHGAMTGKMMIDIEEALIKEKPGWVLVEGDTNTVLAGALAASKLKIKLGHIEAGLRSYDRDMPEELNRIVVDHLADALFCPTNGSANNAVGEGIDKARVFVTGNTVVDAVQQNLSIAEKSSAPHNYKNSKYILLTMHRPGNVDQKAKLQKVVKSLEKVVDDLGAPILFPIHPRTKSALSRFNIKPDPKKIQMINPVGYLEMLLMMKNAHLIITDSGGVQEEACILKVPCVTIRDNTERPETIEVGANILSKSDGSDLSDSVKKILQNEKSWQNPYGNGDSAIQILEHIKSK